MMLDVHLIPYTKINSKWIKGLKVNVKTIKFSEENIVGKPHGTEFGSGFLDKTLKEQTTKVKTNRIIKKLKNSLHPRMHSTE